MARKRKTETKAPVKPPVKYVAVRKSSRQMAKKQQEDKRVNGTIVEKTIESVPSKKIQNSQRKNGKHRHSSQDGEAIETRNNVFDELDGYKRDAGDSDSQDGSEVVLDSDKLSPEDVRQMVVGTPNDNGESAPNEVEVWPEQVIEETIICEEMEVEGDAVSVHDGFTVTQEGDVMMEQVLLVDEPNLEGKDYLRFAVIQNEDGTESMVMSSDAIIQENDSSLPTTEPERTASVVYTDDSQDSSSETLGNSDKIKGKTAIGKSKSVCDSKTDSDESKTDSLEGQCFEALKEDSTESSASNNECAVRASESLRTSSKEDPLDDKLSTMRISENCKEIEKLVKDLESVDSPVQNFPPMSVEKMTIVGQDDESSSSILDKMEQLHRPNNPENLESNNVDEFLANSSFFAGKLDSRLKPAEDKKSRRNSSFLPSIREALGDCEADNKMEREDVKSSSSSENSSDTMLSTNSCKAQESDGKTASNQPNDIEKKTEFRNRSGSTDTTGSESGSNSSGVRRSSRIRSIGLMKQRSHGRGLVTKPSGADISKAIVQQDREKTLNNNVAGTQESKTSSESPNEAQSDKENNGNKVTTSSAATTTTTPPLASPAAPASTCGSTGYDSDSSKPVKVKSRWRRSSELEMGSSGMSFSGVSVSGFSFGLPAVSSTEIPTTARVNGSTTDPATSTNSQVNVEIEKPCENPASNSLPVSTIIPRTVGAKISLPMLLETKDREMEERLSQFEHLRENLYLTERYTNKETKRMVCDCFLTEEEIERGELGCGEDCLNRLLMIECGPRCVVGDRCTNKRFQNCEYAKCEVFRTEKKGFGLRATVDLDAGEFIMEYVGEVVDPKDFRRRAKEYSKDKNRHYYFMALKSDQIIDATMKGNVSRFINHSCDPNAETQKWTVNGELRIGFFIKKFIAAGEEITFDYHFQRYGKEAQKCFCEATNCRGWIGDTPEEEKEKTEKKEKREKDVTRKKKEEKKSSPDHMEDEDLKEEIDKLCLGGLKNRAHTLTLSRLMVRSRELEHRTRLLKVIQTGEQPCRRLFLDYHGLRLIWSYVMDVANDETEDAQQFRLEVLKTLHTLPIPNKTMLMDSKIYGVVEKWAKNLYLSPNGDSPEDEQAKVKTNGEELESNCEQLDKKNEQTNDILIKAEGNSENAKPENVDQTIIPALASSLLAEWSNLKEVFRIPKKERIEQMKEHEREADRGYREELEKEERRGTSYDRHRSDRYVRGENDKRSDRRRGRDSPEAEHSRTKDKKAEERSSLVPIPRMTKYERRQLFALKVAKEEEERQRRQQQESWQEHEARCLALGIDPHTTAMVDPQTGYPLFFNPALGQWQHYPMQEGGEVAQQCTPVYVGPTHGAPSMMAQNSHLLTPPISTDIGTAMPPGTSPVVYSLNQSTGYNPTTTSYPLLVHRHQQYPGESPLPLGNTLATPHNSTTAMTMQTQALYVEKSSSGQRLSTATTVEAPPQPEIPPIDLPPKWKSARDARGRVYYYHVKERISQWLPPPPDHIGVQPDSSSSSESSEDSSSSNEDEEELEEEQPEDAKNEDVEMDGSAAETVMNETKQPPAKKPEVFSSTGNTTPVPETKKRRDGLVQERIISPRREEDRMDHKRYKEIKDKLRRQKERAKLKEHVDKLRKHRRSNKSKSHSRHGTSKLQTASSDATTISERKIKDAFRINMANVMVHFLNPYRKNDCKQGRITNTEDFKHLARKLTHFVLAKELKHCKSVDELQCNDNVKHKAKDFVRKYMSKFGAVYQKGTDED